MNTNIGFYGKLPIVGDFISRRLPNEFIRPWDKWLQSAMAASREALEHEWLNHYLTCPIWRFLLSAGVCGNQAVAGIMMPSVDRVGRYYPLTVAVLLEQAPPLPFLFMSNNVWFEQLEDVALTGLEGSVDVNGFDELIQRIPNFTLSDNLNGLYKTTTLQQLDNGAVLNAEQLATFSAYSLWSNEGSEPSVPLLLASEGLPPIRRFAELLQGNINHQSSLTDLLNHTEAVEELPSLSALLGDCETTFDWQSFGMTDTGKRRKHNEDSLLNRPEANLWVVADGMGGHKAGDVASQLIVNTLNSVEPVEPLEDYMQVVSHALQNVNTQLRQLANEQYSHQVVGSTVVALVCDKTHCGFLWAGDSRLYRFRNQQLEQLTKDHCLGNEEGGSEYSLKTANIITRAVGADDELQLDSRIVEVSDDDVFLLSSDGLDKELSFKKIEHIMQTTPVQNIAQTLIDETLAHGARDNVTVIVITKQH